MQSIKAILQSFNPTKDKYISREFQKYGYDLSEELGDFKHKALYIKLAKTISRSILEKARNFVKGAGNVRSKPRLFMWKLMQLKREIETKGSEGEVQQNTPKELARIHLLISGDVVGVGFRAWVLSLARRAGLTGWVKNASYGTVEIVFEGDKAKLNQTVLLCRRGPSMAGVEDVSEHWESYKGEFRTFEVRF